MNRTLENDFKNDRQTVNSLLTFRQGEIFVVMAQPPGRKAYGRDPYGSYLRKGTYYDNDTIVYPLRHQDKRFHKKTPMYCLELNGALLAIDIGYVKRKGAVNFFLGPTALLAVHDPGLDVIRIFDRKIWEEPFLFIRQAGKIIDIHSRSIWNPANGKAVSGAMKGASLKQFFGVYSMWMAWYSINPETYVIPGPGEVNENLLSTSPPGRD